MYSILLKKALPFALTFVFGAALSALVGLSGGAEQKKFEWTSSTSTYEFGSRCRMRRHNLVAESKPLRILYKPGAAIPDDFKPDATWPWPGDAKGIYNFPGATVRVTFGADGNVQRVEPSDDPYPSLGTTADRVVWECMERAARQIRFEPETVDGLPVTVTRDVEIRFDNAVRMGR
ncbi:MAG: hypothetical protein JOZ96_25230 [Acidobacteria bacterium]|nr:hypothetical protein [Acidobacteriota bacterium]